jgi:hypothetical protein
MSSATRQESNFVVARRVIRALIVRNVRTRSGRSAIGFLKAIFIPFLHLAVVVVVYTALGRMTPIGTDTITFLALGVVPFVLFMYPARMIMISLAESKPLLYLPTITTLSIIVSRAIVETIAACAVCSIFVASLIGAGHEFAPHDAAIVVRVSLGGLVGGRGRSAQRYYSIGGADLAVRFQRHAVGVLRGVGLDVPAGLASGNRPEDYCLQSSSALRGAGEGRLLRPIRQLFSRSFLSVLIYMRDIACRPRPRASAWSKRVDALTPVAIIAPPFPRFSHVACRGREPREILPQTRDRTARWFGSEERPNQGRDGGPGAGWRI